MPKLTKTHTALTIEGRPPQYGYEIRKGSGETIGWVTQVTKEQWQITEHHPIDAPQFVGNECSTLRGAIAELAKHVGIKHDGKAQTFYRRRP